MTADSFDPYRSPTLPEVPYAGVAPSARPGLLTTLCVLCMVLGVLGVMNSLLGAMGAAGGRAFQAWVTPKTAPGMPPEMQEAQQKFQDDVAAVQDKFFWAIVPSIGFRFIAATLLLIGGIQALSLKESGRKVLLIACVVAAVFELCHSILQSLVNLEMMTAVNSYVENLMNAIPQKSNTPPGFTSLMQTFTRGAIVVSLILSYLIALLKVGLYLSGLVYLQKKEIRGRFLAHQPLMPTSVF